MILFWDQNFIDSLCNDCMLESETYSLASQGFDAAMSNRFGVGVVGESHCFVLTVCLSVWNISMNICWHCQSHWYILVCCRYSFPVWCVCSLAKVCIHLALALWTFLSLTPVTPNDSCSVHSVSQSGHFYCANSSLQKKKKVLLRYYQTLDVIIVVGCGKQL